MKKSIQQNRTFFLITLVSGLLALNAAPLWGRVQVAATSLDLASIAKQVGGELVKVESLAEGNDDLHYLAARPDYALRVNRADLFLQVGADLEVAWAPLVLKNSRNPSIQPGGAGHCDVSKGVSLLERRSGEINRQMGDIHPFGNPHYWTDPLNGIRMAQYIASCLGRVDPANRERYQKNYGLFRKKATALTKRLLTQMKPHFGKSVVAYHNEFLYLTKRFRLKSPLYIEEKPGISPSPARIRVARNFIIQNRIRVILIPPWGNRPVAERVARGTGAKIIILPIQTGSTPGTGDYLKMIERCIQILAVALSA